MPKQTQWQTKEPNTKHRKIFDQVILQIIPDKASKIFLIRIIRRLGMYANLKKS